MTGVQRGIKCVAGAVKSAFDRAGPHPAAPAADLAFDRAGGIR